MTLILQVRAQIFLLSYICLSGYLPSVQTDVVDTDGGPVRGLTWSMPDGEELAVFLGIPFAQPPLGTLRFRPPATRVPWRPAEWNATYFRSACSQRLYYIQDFSFGDSFRDTSEDCLYLNVFVPRSSVGSGRLPVMVWIHGGAYNYGSGSEYLGQELASRGVVVVTINYRLGVLGFLSTESDESPGNYGLLDQIEALRWTQRNIAKFGGDPAKVVILGQSAGGGSVSLLQFSPLARGLYRGIVPQSGISLSSWAIYRPPYHPRANTVSLASRLGCATSPDSTMVSCLRNQSVASLLTTRVAGPPTIATWAPTVDGRVIPDLPERLLEKGLVTRVPVMTGTVPQEAADELEDIEGVQVGINTSSYRELVHGWSQRFGVDAEKVEHALLREYPAGSNPATNRENYIQLRSDYGYVAPHNQFALAFSRLNGSIWLYSFRYQPRQNRQPAWMGVYHGQELYYEFGTPSWHSSCPGGCPRQWVDHQNWTQEEVAFSRHLITVWTNFAKNLDPNPVPGLNQSWVPYFENPTSLLKDSSPAKAYLVIDRRMTIASDQEARRMSFWNTALPQLLTNSPVVG